MAQARITCEELPARPRALQQSELTKVFGGCKGRGSVCAVNSDCCSNRCSQVTSVGGYLSFIKYLACA